MTGKKIAQAGAGIAGLLGLGAAWWGWNFSPSFTMLFCAINLTLCAAAELLGRGAGLGFRFLSGVLFFVGMIFAFPSVYIYAAGDDWISGCVWAGMGVGTILCVASCFLLASRKSRKEAGKATKGASLQSAGSVITSPVSGSDVSGSGVSASPVSGSDVPTSSASERWISFCAACFTLFCGFRSVALLPYAAGLFLLTAARLVSGEKKVMRAILFCLGIWAAAVFTVLPGVC